MKCKKIQQHCVSVIEGIQKKNNKNAIRNHLWKKETEQAAVTIAKQ